MIVDCIVGGVWVGWYYYEVEGFGVRRIGDGVLSCWYLG